MEAKTTKGHVQYSGAHVHYLPISAIWNTYCEICGGDHQFGKGALGGKTSRKSGMQAVELHLILVHGQA